MICSLIAELIVLTAADATATAAAAAPAAMAAIGPGMLGDAPLADGDSVNAAFEGEPSKAGLEVTINGDDIIP